jgi:hypothetical protein
MITRRHAVAAVVTSTILELTRSKQTLAQDGPVELTEVPFDPTNVELAVPTCSVIAAPSIGDKPPQFTGDLDVLWRSPWDIGTKSFEIGCTIVQRFVGTDTQGYSLGSDGLVFQSVIYGKYGFQQYFFAGVNSDLTDLASARTLLVTGTYGGVQHNTDSQWDDPVIIVSKLEVPQ